MQLLDALSGARATRGWGRTLGCSRTCRPSSRASWRSRRPRRLPEDPAERRARFQTALHDWFLAVAAEQPLLVAVDNAAGRRRQLRGVPRGARHTKRAAHGCCCCVTQRAATQWSRRGAGARDCASAARVSSSRARARARARSWSARCSATRPTPAVLAKLLYEKSAGNPQLCMDLAQLLVKQEDRRVRRRRLGAAARGRRGRAAEPRRGAAGRDARRAAVRTPAAVRGAEHPRPSASRSSAASRWPRIWASATCISRSTSWWPSRSCWSKDGRYGVSAAGVARIGAGADRRRAPQAAAPARARSVARGGGGQRQLSGWRRHGTCCMRAKSSRGADLMARAAREFLRHQGVGERRRQVVHGDETALALYEKQSRSKYEIASLLFPLMSLAFFVDWRVTLEHGERAINLGLDITGPRPCAALEPLLAGQAGARSGSGGGRRALRAAAAARPEVQPDRGDRDLLQAWSPASIGTAEHRLRSAGPQALRGVAQAAQAVRQGTHRVA